MEPLSEMAKEAEKHIREIHSIAEDGNFQQQLKDYYQKWSETYDKDMNTTHYGGPALGAEALSKVLSDKSALILDCASGTGKVGQELAKRSFKRIDALDFSQKCLEISALKGVYQRFICDEIGGGKKLKDVEDGHYDAVICVGAISVGHLSHDVFPEWNRIVKTGGFIVFTRSKLLFPDGSHEHTNTLDKIQEAINDMIQKGEWEVVDIVSVDKSFCVGYGADVYSIRRL